MVFENLARFRVYIRLGETPRGLSGHSLSQWSGSGTVSHLASCLLFASAIFRAVGGSWNCRCGGGEQRVTALIVQRHARGVLPAAAYLQALRKPVSGRVLHKVKYFSC